MTLEEKEELRKQKKREYNRKYYENHKKQAYEYTKRWREKNKDKLKEYNKKYYETHKEQHMAYTKEYKARNPKKWSKKVMEYKRKRADRLRAEGCLNPWSVITTGAYAIYEGDE